MALGQNLKKLTTDIQKTKSKDKVKKVTESADEKLIHTESQGKEAGKLTTKKITVNKGKPESDVQALKSINKDVNIEQDDSGEKVMLIVFPVGNEEYAMSIDMIKEVVSTPPIAPVPQAPKYIKGAANVRGTVLAVIDLNQKFGLLKSDENSNELEYVLVLKNEEYRMAVAVNKIPDTVIVNSTEIDPPATLTNNSGLNDNYIKGIIKRDKRMIILIDVLEMIMDEEAVSN